MRDEQHAEVNHGGAVLRVRPPTPGRCPRLVAGAWKDVGTWQAAALAATTRESTSAWTSASRVVVCDPANGRYRWAFDERSEGSQYGTSSNRVSRIAQVGPWLVAERADADLPWSTTIIDLATDRPVATISGTLGGGEVQGSVTSLRAPWFPGARVAAVPGAIAWTVEDEHLGRAASSATVVLADDAGVRSVGTVRLPDRAVTDPSPPSPLRLERHRLSWPADGGSREVPVRPAAPGGLAVTRLPG
ncbi:MAG: hypothetical protein M0P31_11965 [Solirubrobacteraceae bacterium]|nr:hypothetical protein [Solirubrobacteraceae bacterium]